MTPDELVTTLEPPDFTDPVATRKALWEVSAANHDAIVGIKAGCAARLPICMARFDRISQVALGGNVAAAEIKGEHAGETVGKVQGEDQIERAVGHVVVVGVKNKLTPILLALLTAALGASTLWGHIERGKIGDEAKAAAKAAVTTAVAATKASAKHGVAMDADNEEILMLLRRLAAFVPDAPPPPTMGPPRTPPKVEPLVTMPNDSKKETTP